VVDVLLDRVVWAADETGVDRVALSGGVAANSLLRTRIQELPGIDAFVPDRARCTDNGAMIAHAGRLHLLAGTRHGLDFSARPRWQPGEA